MSHSLFELFSRPEAKGNQGKDMKLIVKKANCPQNHHCPSIRVCPVDALSQRNFEAPVVDQEKCIQCGKCVRYCPMKALVLQ